MLTILIIIAAVVAMVLIGAYLVIRSAAQDINDDYQEPGTSRAMDRPINYLQTPFTLKTASMKSQRQNS